MYNHSIKYLYSNSFAYSCGNKLAYLIDASKSLKATHCEESMIKQVLKYKLIV